MAKEKQADDERACLCRGNRNPDTVKPEEDRKYKYSRSLEKQSSVGKHTRTERADAACKATVPGTLTSGGRRESFPPATGGKKTSPQGNSFFPKSFPSPAISPLLSK